MIICVTGVSGAGKSTALKIIKDEGLETFEMDRYIHDIYNFNEIGYNLIKKTFGVQYVNEISVDRKKLGRLVFNNEKDLLLLNNVIQPLIISKIEKLAKNKLIFVELAIYLNYLDVFKPYFDEVILICAEQSLITKNNKKKFGHVGKFPTINVENSINPIKTPYIDTKLIVNNTGTLEQFKINLKKILENINKSI